MARPGFADLVLLRKQAATKGKIILADNHPRSRTPGNKGGIQPRRTGADHQEIAKQIALFVTVGIRQIGGLAQAGRPPDQRLVELLPKGSRPHEGFVIKTCGQNTG